MAANATRNASNATMVRDFMFYTRFYDAGVFKTALRTIGEKGKKK